MLEYNDIVSFLGDHNFLGDRSLISFTKISSVFVADKDSLVFISKRMENVEELIDNTFARVILVEKNSELKERKGKVLILVDNPKLVFSKIGNRFFVPEIEYSIHPSAVIHPEAVISKNVYIGPNCIIGKGEIQERTVIYGNVVIHDNFFIGKNVKIHSSTVIGSDGFGYSKDTDEMLVHFPHIGGVVIEDNVHIGSNTSIDRGALTDTIIKKGAKIDNLVHIAHNVIVGKNTMVVANSMIGGSTIIGENAYVGPSTSLRDVIKIGDRAFIGMASSVLKDVPNDEIWTGVPAQPLEKVKLMNEKLKKL